MNKNGLPVGSTPREILEELNRGTGCVMADNLSIFLEKESLHQKCYVVVQGPVGDRPVSTQKFESNRSQDALDHFMTLMKTK